MQMKEKICLIGLLLGTNHGCITINPNQSVLQCSVKPPSSPSTKKFKVAATVFWAPQGVLLAHFQKRGENVNSASYCEVLLKLRDAIHRQLPGQMTRRVVLHYDNARPHTARETQQRIQEL
jgi:hypothetical protein